jgi:membrane protein implicated in regulation of membrane protease activity
VNEPSEDFRLKVLFVCAIPVGLFIGALDLPWYIGCLVFAPFCLAGMLWWDAARDRQQADQTRDQRGG